MSNQNVIKYLENLEENYADPIVRGQASEVKKLYQQKLWHQITGVINSIIQLQHFHSGPAFERKDLVAFYQNVISDFADKLQPFELAKMMLIISNPFGPAEKATFLSNFLEKIKRDQEPEAWCLIKAEVGFINLQISKVDVAKQTIDELDRILSGVTGFKNMVYTHYYRLLAQYYKIKVNSTEYYKNTLFYLVYTPLNQIPIKDQHLMAFDLGIAALVSKEIYNFGELLAHKITESLSKNADLGWIVEILTTVNRGDIQGFNKAREQFKAKIENTNILKLSMGHISEKVAIAALVELIFSKPSDQRMITFAELAKGTQLAGDQVELLVMKTLSLGLIKGSMDEVDQTLTVNWVQPRVLSTPQISTMCNRLNDWNDKVSNLLTFIQNETAPELLL